MFRGTDDGGPGKNKRPGAGLEFSLGASFGPEQAKADDFRSGPEFEGPLPGARKAQADGNGDKSG